MTSILFNSYTPIHITSLGVGWLVGWLVGLSVTLCSIALDKTTNKFNTVLERGKIPHEDPTIKNPDFPLQESGMSFMSPKGQTLT